LIETKAKLLTVHEQYQETLDYISTQSVESAGLKLLESYCLYKLGQLEKANKALSNPLVAAEEEVSRAKLALESQIVSLVLHLSSGIEKNMNNSLEISL
jgi:hypothetical protein